MTKRSSTRSVCCPIEVKRSYVSNQQQLSDEEKILSDAHAETQRINELFDAQKKTLPRAAGAGRTAGAAQS